MNTDSTSSPQCPLPVSDESTIRMAHGGGGRFMHRLIQDVFVAAFSNPLLTPLHDGAVFSVAEGRLAMTTDSYVVHPLFFPGGNIGSMAVHGTVNDLAMCGARPQYLSAGFVLEEGLEIDLLKQVVHSMAEAARTVRVPIICGDTKVVDRGKGDQLFINTTGVGIVPQGVDIGPHRIQPGDAIVVSGDVGAHGMAVLSVREGLAFSGNVASDSAPLHDLVADLLQQELPIHCLRDLTRGGLTSALHELANAAQVQMMVEDAAIPVSDPVRGACELLGMDPLYVACEGRCVAFLPASYASRALDIFRAHSIGQGAAEIGQVLPLPSSTTPPVVIRTIVGTHRILDLPSGEQLPRIC